MKNEGYEGIKGLSIWGEGPVDVETAKLTPELMERVAKVWDKVRVGPSVDLITIEQARHFDTHQMVGQKCRRCDRSSWEIAHYSNGAECKA